MNENAMHLSDLTEAAASAHLARHTQSAREYRVRQILGADIIRWSKLTNAEVKAACVHGDRRIAEGARREWRRRGFSFVAAPRIVRIAPAPTVAPTQAEIDADELDFTLGAA